MITVSSRGDYKKTRDFIDRMLGGDLFSGLDYLGRIGVDALANATPTETGLTASSWGYRLIKDPGRSGIEWFNTNVTKSGIPVAILIQYGHATGTGGYVHGVDYINPAMRPIFDMIAAQIWKEVTA